MFVKLTKNFLGVLEKNSAQKIRKKHSDCILNSISDSFLGLKLFFTGLLKSFCWLYEHVKGNWKVRPTLIFASVKKNRDYNSYDSPIKLYVRKSEKSWDVEKMKLKIRLEYSDKTWFFGMKLVSKTSRKFSVDFTSMFKVSERPA